MQSYKKEGNINIKNVPRRWTSMLRTSSRWPRSPAKIAMQTSDRMFHIRTVSSLLAESRMKGSTVWKQSSFTLFPCPVNVFASCYGSSIIFDKKLVRYLVIKYLENNNILAAP